MIKVGLIVGAEEGLAEGFKVGIKVLGFGVGEKVGFGEGEVG